MTHGVPPMAFPGAEASQAERTGSKDAERAVFGSHFILPRRASTTARLPGTQAMARLRGGRGKGKAWTMIGQIVSRETRLSRSYLTHGAVLPIKAQIRIFESSGTWKTFLMSSLLVVVMPAVKQRQPLRALAQGRR